MELSDFCQSCGMPLQGNKDLMGTNKDSSLNNDYCQHCFREGKFTVEKISMEEMIEVCLPYLVKYKNFTEEKAREQMKDFFPYLKRWKKS